MGVVSEANIRTFSIFWTLGDHTTLKEVSKEISGAVLKVPNCLSPNCFRSSSWAPIVESSTRVLRVIGELVDAYWKAFHSYNLTSVLTHTLSCICMHVSTYIVKSNPTRRSNNSAKHCCRSTSRSIRRPSDSAKGIFTVEGLNRQTSNESIYKRTWVSSLKQKSTNKQTNMQN